ncbi:unnamed protein product [Cuscuta europaea]|uniref:ABC-type xenobiotic transporter n=1 Tax=Cuscuta europaea TaxID=41803 RepID=A0A9P0YYX7_CUSEU|nr:unnamed protein product [Cuscuta europaea]
MSSSASSPWLSSLECSSSAIVTSDHSSLLSVVIQWLRFIFLSPCPQRLLFSAIDLIFLLSVLVLAIQKLCIRFIRRKNKRSYENGSERLHYYKATLLFYLSLIVTSLLALAYSNLCIFTFIKGLNSKWDFIEALFMSLQAVTHITLFVLIALEKRYGVVDHPMSIRAYWTANFSVACLFAASAVTRLVYFGYKEDLGTSMDDLFFLASLPLCCYLFIMTVKGSSGVHSVVREVDTSNVSGYAKASVLSKAMWNWMNPLLTKGYKSPLTIDEVPSLPPDFDAERMGELLRKNWHVSNDSTIPSNTKHPILKALARSFWKDLMFTGFLATVRLGVMYVGPLLIKSFVKFTSGDRTKSPYKGYYLVMALLGAKVTEVMASHHFNFHSAKLGMLIRSSIMTTLYKKGLRLSCTARQAHGVGQIVNYMVVDCTMISDMSSQLHTIWMMPMQLVAALLLLYIYIGSPVIASLGAVCLVTALTFVMAIWANTFQFNLMANRDQRLKAINEVLGNMRVIKFQAWEEHFSKKIQAFRLVEFGWLGKLMYLMATNLSFLWSIPNVISAVTFVVAVLFKIPLDAGTVFTATTILKILQEPIRTFPHMVIYTVQAYTSLKRLDAYLTSPELDNKFVQREDGSGGGDDVTVEVKNGNFCWDEKDEKKVLRDICFEVRKGELAAIVGTVGSGKSSLLASVLGELHKLSGKVRVCGTTAYVAQTSWIQNATIQDNILFGSPMDRERYNDTIKVCSLEKDFETMEHGDQTEIGERGINLSGGQKQRIQLARAVYQDCDIYLLDDVFSAVDAQTGSEIFKGCVRGALKDKTVLLVTHQVDFLHNADLIMVMREGKIVQSGKYTDLLESGMDFGDLVAAHENSMELVETSSSVSDKNHPKSPRQQSPKSLHKPEDQLEPKDQPEPNADSKLIEDEQRETGHVSFDVYKQYCTEAYGWWGVIVVMIASILWQLGVMANDYWLAYETSSVDGFKPSLFIIIYSTIGGISCILVVLRSFVVAALGLKTSQGFFTQIIGSILRAPMSFFDTTPSGRILSRVSIDQASVDFVIPLLLSSSLALFFTVIGILIVMCQNAWPTVFLLFPLIWLNIWYRKYYIASSRELTRLDSITRAPIIHHFSETINGIMTIRCFRKEETFFQGNVDRVNANLRMDFHNNGSNEWFGFRLEFIGSVLLCASTLFMVMIPSNVIGSEYIGMALSYGLSLNSVLFTCVSTFCVMENRMVSVERIKQFIKIRPEAAWKTSFVPPSNWPNHGNIEIKDLKVRYRDNAPLVLKGITVGINGGEKIGVVGRTGSGKSTLIQVFFRLVEPAGGSIIIDGIDICKLGLHRLRSRFGIIPQEPVLFEGTVRNNIDPLGLYSDDEIWKSLERCQLKEVVAEKPGKLDASVAYSGDNWSVGQRQLLCLGRVMLKNTQILFMDEATASVDTQTDVVIQRVIREDFINCTVITIAHRIPSVIDCDRVLIIDNGWVKEFEAPGKLLERPSLFRSLVQEYSHRSSGV